MREALSKRPRLTVKTSAKTAKTKIAETRTQAKLRPVPKSKTISAPKPSARSAAKGKTASEKPSKTLPKAATGKKTIGRPRNHPAVAAVKKDTVAKSSESSAKTKIKETKVRAKASAKASGKTAGRTSTSPASVVKPEVKSVDKVQPGKALAKGRRKIVLPIQLAPPPAAPPRRAITSGALRAFEHAVRVFNRRHFEEAKPMLENLLAKYPGEVEIIARTQMYLQVCNQKLSQTQSAPHNADELYDRGVYALNIGDFSQAKTFFEKALRLKPEEPYLLYSLAATHAQTGAMEQALDYLKRTFQIQPRYRTQALHDADFSGLRENKQFLELLGLASPFDLLQSRR
jgi:hypothetical protein